MIDTLANVKLALQVVTHTDDERLGQLATAAEAFISAYCNRSFGGGTHTEYFAGGQTTLVLAHWPVLVVTSINVDPAGLFPPATTRPTTAYTLDEPRGLIQHRDGPFIPTRPGFPVRLTDFPRTVRVIYTTHSSSVPAGLQRAYAELIGHWYRIQNTYTETNQTLKTSQTNGTTVTAYPWTLGHGSHLPRSVLELLAMYRTPLL
jgi:hypothetical protein